MTPATGLTLALAAAAALLATPIAASAQHAAPPPPADQASTRLSIDSPVAALAADPRIRAILDREVPAMTGHPHYPMFKEMSLRVISQMPQSKTELGLDETRAVAIQAQIDKLPRSARSQGDVR